MVQPIQASSFRGLHSWLGHKSNLEAASALDFEQPHDSRRKSIGVPGFNVPKWMKNARLEKIRSPNPRATKRTFTLRQLRCKHKSTAGH